MSINETTEPRLAPRRNIVIGHLDGPAVDDQDWPAWSAGYEAGLAAGIATSHLHVTVELAPVGASGAGVRAWRALCQARLQEAVPPGGTRTGPELIEEAHQSWNLATEPTPAVDTSTSVPERESVQERETVEAAGFSARFDSTCPACGHTIHEDDPASWLEGQVVHAGCAQAAGVTVITRRSDRDRWSA